MSQRARVLLILAVAMTPLLVLAIALLWREAGAGEARIARERLGLARAAALATEAFVEGNLSVLESLASDLSPSDGADIEALPERLAGVVAANPEWQGFTVVGADGWNLASSATPANTVNTGDRPYFQDALATGESVVSAAIIGRLSGLPSIVFATPLDLPGGERGALTAHVPVAELAEGLRINLATQDARIVLVDQDGQTFVHPDEERVRLLTPAIGRPDVDAVLRGDAGTIVHDRDGVETLTAYAPVGNAGWGVLVLEPASTAFAPVQRALLQGLGLLALGALGVGLIGWYFSGRLSRSYDRLNATTREADEARADAEVARHKYMDLVDGVDAIVWEADARTFEFHYVSQRAERILGYPTRRWLSEPTFWADHIHADDREQAVNYCRACTLAGQDHSFEYRAIAADGGVVWLEDVVRVVRDPDGQPSLLRGVMIDVTERRRADDERARLLRAEQAARERAEEAVRGRDEFLSIASHELRNPVAGIKGTSELMKRFAERGTLTPEALIRYADTITRTSERLARLVEDLLDVTRLQGGRLTLRLDAVDIAALVRDTVAEQSAESGAPPIEVTGADEPCIAEADPDRIRQIVQNLAENAVKYSPGGQGVRVVVDRATGQVTVSVHDQGIGLSEQGLGDIFQPFGRASNAAEANIPGMGLGLYICRRLAEAHGGSIDASSPGEGQGSTFVLSLPVTAAPPERVVTGSAAR